MTVTLPLSRPLPLTAARVAALKSPIALTRDGVATFIARFTAMSLAQSAADGLCSAICLQTSKQDLLAAIAYNQIATRPGGYAFLCEDARLQGVLDMSAELLLSELTPEARRALLAVPPDVRAGGLAVVTLGEAGGERIELVLTPGCFGDATHVGSWQLTPREIAPSGWRQKNDAQEYTFLRALVELTKTSQLERAYRPTLERIVNLLTGAGLAGLRSARDDAANAALCEQLAVPAVWNLPAAAAAYAAPSARGVSA